MGNLFLALNLLSAAGALIVAGLLTAAALGRWRRGLAFRVMTRMAVAGGLLPFLLLPVWTYVNRHFALDLQVGFEKLAIIAWPSSIGLMALEAPGTAGSKVVVVCVLVLMNLGLYGLIGLCLGMVWEKAARVNSVLERKGQ